MANVIVAGLAERAGYPISFGTFLRCGLIITMESLLIAALSIWLRYLSAPGERSGNEHAGHPIGGG